MELPAKKLSFRQPRHTMRLDRNAMLALGAIPNILKVGSGPIGALKNAARVFREKGWTGLKQRLFLLSNSNKFAYQAWIDEFDTLDEAARAHILANIENLATRPLISVLMPVFNPEPRFLDKAIASVRSQLYPTWELCIADDASTNSEIRKILEQHAAEESRIKLVFRERNGHISEASNSALGFAEGEFVALLDHDDILREHALYCVADTILGHPDAGLIYSDEDKCDEMGARRSWLGQNCYR
jgi:hypothetical protein